MASTIHQSLPSLHGRPLQSLQQFQPSFLDLLGILDVASTIHESLMTGEHADFDILSKRMGEDTPGDMFRLELRGPEFVEGIIGPAEVGGDPWIVLPTSPHAC